MDTDHIARAAAELEQAIRHTKERLRQLTAALTALEPFVSTTQPGDVREEHAARPATEPDQAVSVHSGRLGPLVLSTTEIRNLLGPSQVVEQIFRDNPGREMTFQDIEAELERMNVTMFGRDQVRGAVYYGRRSGWAEHGTRRGQWRLRDTSAPDEPGAEGMESRSDSSSDQSDGTYRTGGGSVDSAPLPSRDEGEF